MTIRWRELNFLHKCGLVGTILRVLVSSDGEILVGGVCVTCGEEFSTTIPMVTAIARAAILDYQQQEGGENVLENFTPKGKPN